MHILKWDILKNTKNNHIERVKETSLVLTDKRGFFSGTPDWIRTSGLPLASRIFISICRPLGSNRGTIHSKASRPIRDGMLWYARLDSNQRPTESESVTLSN